MADKKNIFYGLIFCVAFLSACQKEDIAGNYDYKPLGSSAHDLLTASPYAALQIEIDYMPGFAVDNTVINNLVYFLNVYINKPGGIKVYQRQIAASGKPSLSLTDIVSIEKSNRVFFTSPGNMGVHILITDGYFTTPGTFATSYWNTSTCIFGKTIDDNSDDPGLVTKTNLLSTVMQHEMGHLLGLVNQGSPMQTNHKDATNGAHCSNTACLMYYAIQTNANAINGIPELDADCMNDLKANGGK